MPTAAVIAAVTTAFLLVLIGRADLLVYRPLVLMAACLATGT